MPTDLHLAGATTAPDPPLRVMSLHALAYCHRLFYLEEVEEIRVAGGTAVARYLSASSKAGPGYLRPVTMRRFLKIVQPLRMNDPDALRYGIELFHVLTRTDTSASWKPRWRLPSIYSGGLPLGLLKKIDCPTLGRFLR